MGAPVGNQNAAKGRVWRAAIERALERRSKADQVAAVDALADKLLDACEAGDLPALKELGDRLDGKPAQAVAIANDGDEPFRVEKIVRELVRPPTRNG